MANGDLLWYDQVANLDLFWPGGPRFHGLSAEVHADGRVLSLPGEEPHCQIGADHAAWHLDEHALRIVWRWHTTGDDATTAASGWDVWLEVTNTGRKPIRLHALDPLRVLVCDLREPETPPFYQHGWSSRTPTLVRQPEGAHYVEPDDPDPEFQMAHQPHDRPGYGHVLESEWVTVLKSPTGSALLGFVTAADQLATIRLDEPQLITRCWLDGAELKPGQSVRSETLWIRVGNDPLTLLEVWGERLGNLMRARLGRSRRTGWCPQYQLVGTITASEILDNLDIMDDYDLPLDVILVDDGYQTAVGDWLSVNEVFPNGMKTLADRIQASGRVAGIWTAPFAAAADSRLFLDHPEWFVRGDEGRPTVAWRHQLSTDCYALDPTHPGAATWLDATFRTLRWEWGYTFFKIDIISAAAIPGRRHDATATRAQSLRRGVEIIRQAVGDDAFLLGSGAPQEVCVGLVDGMRVGPDTAPYWSPAVGDLSLPAQQNALRSSITRAAFHNRLWLNDPDCLILNPEGDGSDLSLNEIRSQVAVVALLGGLVLDGDDLVRIRPSRLRLLHQALPPSGVSARPLDLFERELPQTLVLRVEREWGRSWVLGLVNWTERTVNTAVRPAELGLPPDQYHVFDFWRRKYVGVCWDEITVPRHRAHETLVLLLKPVNDQPDFLTSTFHVCQGAVEVRNVTRWESSDGTGLQVAIEKAGRQFGELFFVLPQGWQANCARVNGRRRRIKAIAPNVVGLGLTLAGAATVDLEFLRVT